MPLPTFQVCREMVMGKPSPLISSFKLSYYTLLNLLRRLEGSGQDIEYVIKRSFQQFQFESNLPQVGYCPVTCILHNSGHALWQKGQLTC